MKRSNLEETLRVGMYGAPVLYREQRQLFLGELKERVIDAFTPEQLNEKKWLTAVDAALKHPQAALLLLREDVPDKVSDKLRDLAIANGKFARLVSDPDYLPVLAGVVVSRDRVEPQPTTYSWQKETEEA